MLAYPGQRWYHLCKIRQLGKSGSSHSFILKEFTVSALLDKIESVAQEVLVPLQIEVVDVERLTESGRKVLRIYIDKEGGVTLNDCQEASRAVDPALDREFGEEPSWDSLQVSSPGIDRALKKPRDFERFRGHMVEVSLFAPIDNAKKHRGTLAERNDKELVIGKEGNEMRMPVDKVSKVRLWIDWSKTGHKSTGHK
jgi:ribosome maturation factor RimP